MLATLSALALAAPRVPTPRAAARAAVLAPCAGLPSQIFNFNVPFGVLSTSGVCLRAAAGGAGALTFDECEGAGPVHALETTFAVPSGRAGAFTWNGTAHCARAAAGGAASLAPCGAAPPAWSMAAPAGGAVVDAATGQCLTAAAPPLALLAAGCGASLVLQRDAPAAIWGATAPGDVVDVDFAGARVASAPAGADGRWTVSLPATAAGGPYSISATARASGATANLTDVVFGDVYWCSGQSNLDSANTPVRYAYNATAEIAAAAGFPWVRLFKVAHATSTVPLADLAGAPALAWTRAAPTPVATFSACVCRAPPPAACRGLATLTPTPPNPALTQPPQNVLVHGARHCRRDWANRADRARGIRVGWHFDPAVERARARGRVRQRELVSRRLAAGDQRALQCDDGPVRGHALYGRRVVPSELRGGAHAVALAS